MDGLDYLIHRRHYETKANVVNDLLMPGSGFMLPRVNLSDDWLWSGPILSDNNHYFNIKNFDWITTQSLRRGTDLFYRMPELRNMNKNPTSGFFSIMLYLTPLSTPIFSEFSQEDDCNQADTGELLVIPSRQYVERNCESSINQYFIGIDSMEKSSLAMICEGNGRDILESYLVSPYFLEEGYGLSETLQFAIGTSSLLQAIRNHSGIVRLLQTEKGHALLPFYENTNELNQAAAVVHY